MRIAGIPRLPIHYFLLSVYACRFASLIELAEKVALIARMRLICRGI
jgi:hypothetical protein